MKEQIINILKDIHEAKTLIEINDMLNLHTVEEYQQLSKVINDLAEEYILFKTKKDKYILMSNCPGLKVGKLAINKKGFG